MSGNESREIGGKYRLVRLIGEGGMGSVHEAEHVQIGHRVALKFLVAELARNEDALERFRREAEAAGRIRHDNVCEVFDFGIDGDGSPYLVMPLLSGRSLSEVIREAAPLPIPRAIDIASQMLAGLHAAHVAGIVHRDLKPENVFITRVGDRDDFVKILDFGISKAVGEVAGGDKHRTKSGFLLGTPSYMAPEQARGDRDIDGRVDVYAAGVIIYQMLTGRRPFEAETLTEALWKAWNAPITPPRELRPELPEALDGIVMRAMERDRDVRFRSAEELRAALRGEAQPASPDAPESQRAESLIPTMPRPRPAAGQPREMPTGVSKILRTQRGRRAVWLVGALVLVVAVLVALQFRSPPEGRAEPTRLPVTAMPAPAVPAPAAPPPQPAPPAPPTAPLPVGIAPDAPAVAEPPSPAPPESEPAVAEAPATEQTEEPAPSQPAHAAAARGRRTADAGASGAAATRPIKRVRGTVDSFGRVP